MVVNPYNLKIWENLKEYEKEVISIFINKKKNLIINQINSIKNKKNKTICDFGCGTGNSFEYIKDFKKIIAIDFSDNMLKKAKEKSKKLKIKNIEFINSKLQDIKIKEQTDISLALNSIFPSNYNEFDEIVLNLKNSTKNSGEIILVLLSFESLTFFYQILANYEFKSKGKLENSLNLINKYIQDSSYSPFGYIITSLGMQKHWLKEEIKFRLEKYKFKKIKIVKLKLNWATQIKMDNLKEYPKLWFWFVKIKL